MYFGKGSKENFGVRQGEASLHFPTNHSDQDVHVCFRNIRAPLSTLVAALQTSKTSPSRQYDAAYRQFGSFVPPRETLVGGEVRRFSRS